MAKDFEIIGASGLKRFGGYVEEEWHPKLRGVLATRVYSEMRDNDPVIGAFLHALDMLVRSVDWTVEPGAENSRSAEEKRLFVEECLEDMSHPFEDLISEIMSMLVFGWSYFEICYKRRGGPSKDPLKDSRFTDNRIGWRKLAIRSQDTLNDWEFDEDGGIKGMWQISPPSYNLVFIPIEKALLFRTRSTKGNPEGRSILRNAYRSWYLLKRIQEIEAIGVERDLAGLPKLEVPIDYLLSGASSAQKSLLDDFKKMVSEIKRDEREGVIVPAEEMMGPDGKPYKTGFKLSLMSTGGSRQLNTDAIITRYEQRIAMSVLADFIMLGMDKVGSFALASSKTHLFGVALGAWLRSIAAVFNRFAIPRLLALNGYDMEEMPRLTPGDIEAPPLDELGAFLEKTVKIGLVKPDETLERAVRRMAGLPEPDEEEEMMPSGDSPATTKAPGASLAALSPLDLEKLSFVQENEKRQVIGLPPKPGGNAAYKPATQIPVLEDEEEAAPAKPPAKAPSAPKPPPKKAPEPTEEPAPKPKDKTEDM